MARGSVGLARAPRVVRGRQAATVVLVNILCRRRKVKPPEVVSPRVVGDRRRSSAHKAPRVWTRLDSAQPYVALAQRPREAATRVAAVPMAAISPHGARPRGSRSPGQGGCNDGRLWSTVGLLRGAQRSEAGGRRTLAAGSISIRVVARFRGIQESRMDKIERVRAVLEGRHPDRPPFSFWYHFPLSCAAGQAAVDAHVRHVARYDVDFLKIMDDNRYPRDGLPDGMVRSAADLDRLTALDGDEGTFGQQLELIGQLAQRYAGQMLMITTVFNAWATLRLLTAPPADKHGPPKLGGGVDPRDETMSRLLDDSPAGLARALEATAGSLANFCRRCVAAGADGVFLSVRDDWVDTPANGAGTYDRVVQATDLAILRGASAGTFNMLHVCGQAVDFARFAAYPVHAVNWADRYAGPTLAAAVPLVRSAICGGLNNLGTLATGTPEDCEREVADAIGQLAPRPLIVAPGCTFDPDAVPPANLDAVRRAAEKGW